jgi:hypothetical protein
MILLNAHIIYLPTYIKNKKYVSFNYNEEIHRITNTNMPYNDFIEQVYNDTTKIYSNKSLYKTIYIPYKKFIESKFILKSKVKIVDYNINKKTGKRLSISSYIDNIDKYRKFYRDHKWTDEEKKKEYSDFINTWKSHWTTNEIFIDEIKFELTEV